jgi:phage shock protein C
MQQVAWKFVRPGMNAPSDQATPARLRKSATDRIFNGVCGGIAMYLGIDSTLVRIAWVLLALAGGVGIVLYLAAMIIMPSPPLIETQHGQRSREGMYLTGGIFLVAAGLIWILGAADILPFHSLAWFSWKGVLPVILILTGLFLLTKHRSFPVTEAIPKEQQESTPHVPRRLYRSRIDKKLFGVCGGLGVYFDVDPVFVRVLFVAFGIASFGFAILAYLLLSIVVREEPITFAL